MTLPQYAPMLASSKPLAEDTNFVYELKWDGYRAICYIEQNIRLFSRNGKELTNHFRGLLPALTRYKNHQIVLDGEIVALNQNGSPEFALLKNNRAAQLLYIVFDILYCHGENMCPKSWEERRSCLTQVIDEGTGIKISPLLHGEQSELLEKITVLELEGLVAKKRTSPYLPGQRSDYWRKIKPIRTTDCVVGGFFGDQLKVRSLLVGQFNNRNQLIYLGRVGSGLAEKELAFIKEATSLLKSDMSPFVDISDNNGVIWFNPQLVVEIKYMEITTKGRFRHPVFLRFRWDKNPTTCKLEELKWHRPQD